jgi:hypothetical protein
VYNNPPNIKPSHKLLLIKTKVTDCLFNFEMMQRFRTIHRLRRVTYEAIVMSCDIPLKRNSNLMPITTELIVGMHTHYTHVIFLFRFNTILTSWRCGIQIRTGISYPNVGVGEPNNTRQLSTNQPFIQTGSLHVCGGGNFPRHCAQIDACAYIHNSEIVERMCQRFPGLCRMGHEVSGLCRMGHYVSGLCRMGKRFSDSAAWAMRFPDSVAWARGFRTLSYGP